MTDTTKAASTRFEYVKVRPCNASKEEILALAEKVAERWHLEPGGDLMPGVRANGGRVKLVGLSDKDFVDGEIMVYGPSDFEVYLTDLVSMTRRRFTLAHEFGHYILHANLGKDYGPQADGTHRVLFAQRSDSNRAEWEASWFAAGLLMPTKQFSAAIEQLGERPTALAGRFYVSVEAAKLRLDEVRDRRG